MVDRPWDAYLAAGLAAAAATDAAQIDPVMDAYRRRQDIPYGPQETAGAERRGPRRRLLRPVVVESVYSSSQSTSSSCNLSDKGVFVETTDVLEVGDPVMVRLHDKDDMPHQFSGRVRWSSPFGRLDDAVPGMGIEFVGLDDRRRRVLREFLDGDR